VTLVDTLPNDADPILEGDATLRVGISGERGLSQMVELEGRDVDLRNSFPYDVAVELVRDLDQEHISSVLREIDGALFRDKKARYEVHVRTADHERATKSLHDRWQKLAEAEVGAAGGAPEDAGKCPACGSEVPLNVEECPDCGLFVGAAEGDEPAAEAP